TIVPESTRVIEDIQPASDALYIRDLDGGLGRLRRYDIAGGKVADVSLPGDGTLDGPVTDPLKPGALFGLQGWVRAEQWHAVAAGRVSPISLAPPWAEDLSAYVAEEVKVRARDGVMVPLSIVHRKDFARDGKAPLWLTGYGAYGIALKPALAAGRFALLDDGG